MITKFRSVVRIESILRKTLGAILAIAALAVTSPAYATVTFEVSGKSSVGDDVSFKAKLAISGDSLTVTLFNNSAKSSAPSDLLSSFFFDIVKKDGSRPNLNYVSAIGDVWHTSKSEGDELSEASANLKAVRARDYTWQYRRLDPSQNPFAGFGIGTVGDSNLSPNNFNGNIVHTMDYSIYAGDVTTKNLNDKMLVKTTATFTFSGLSGFTYADIARTVTFGLGTAPDSTMRVTIPANEMRMMTITPVPEPTTMIAGALLLLPFGFNTIRVMRKNRKG